MPAFSPRIARVGSPDFLSTKTLLEGPPFLGLEGEELALALWRFVAERFYHFHSAHETEYGSHYVNDACLLLNAYGFGLCGTAANLLSTLCIDAGIPARNVGLKGHVVMEAFFDGRWHLLDPDLHAYHRLHPPDERIIASLEEIMADRTLVSEQKNPSAPYYLPDRRPEKMADLYVSGSTFPAVCEHWHSMDYVLRPGEEIERSWSNEGRWLCFDSYRDAFKRFPKEPGPKGPRGRFPPHRTYGNGHLRYRPDLRAGSDDLKEGGAVEGELEQTGDGLVARGGGSGSVTFRFDCPYPFAGVPDPSSKEPPGSGIILRLRTCLGHPADSIAVRIRGWRPRNPWQLLGKAPPGESSWKLDLTPRLAGHFRFEMKIDLESDAAGEACLSDLELAAIFVCAPASLPALNKGENELRFVTRDAFGLPSVKEHIDVRFDKDGAFERGVVRLLDGVHDPATPEKVLPADDAPYSVIIPLEASPGRRIHWFYFLAHMQAKLPGEAGEDGVNLALGPFADGPWKVLERWELAEHGERWHFGIEHTHRLAEPARKCFLRLQAKTGALGFRVRFHHVAEEPERQRPVQLECRWVEDGEERRLAETLRKPGQVVRVRCEAEPEMRSYTLRVPSARRSVTE